MLGPPRSGTTSLHEYMRTHPELVLPAAKEQPFFADDSVYHEGWDAFEPVAFHGQPSSGVRGLVEYSALGGPVEWEADTAAAPEPVGANVVIARRIRSTFPEIKLVVMLRDPVERAVSSYWRVKALDREARGLNEALEQELDPDALERARVAPSTTNQYVVCGEYGRLVGGYLEVFPRDAFFFGVTARLGRDPIGALVELWRFLGVADDHRPDNAWDRFDTRGTGSQGFGWVSRLADRAPGVRLLFRRLPTGWRGAARARLRQAAYRSEQRTRVNLESVHEELSGELRRRLEEHYAPDLERLASLIGPVEELTGSTSDHGADASTL